MSRRIGELCLVVCLVLTCSTLNAQVTFARKLSNGQKFSSKTTIESNQTLTLNGSDIVTRSNQTRVTKSTVGDRKENGDIDVNVVTDSLQARIEVPVAGLDIKFDSANPGTATDNPLGKLLKVVADTKYTVTYDSMNDVKDVVVSEDALKDLDDATRAMVASQLDSKNVLEAIQSENDLLPRKTLKPGDKWEQTTKMRLEGQQIMTFKMQCAYEGPTRYQGRDVERISIKATEVTYEMEVPLNGLKLQKADLKVDDKGGTLMFDRNLGQIVFQETDRHITGKVDFDLGGTPLPGDLDLNLKITSATN